MQASHVAMFPSRTSEIERLHDEHGPISLNKKDFTRMVLKATQITDEEKYPFLYVDTTVPEKHRFRRNLNTVLEIPEGMREQQLEQEAGGRRGVKRKGEELQPPHQPDTIPEAPGGPREVDEEQDDQRVLKKQRRKIPRKKGY